MIQKLGKEKNLSNGPCCRSIFIVMRYHHCKYSSQARSIFGTAFRILKLIFNLGWKIQKSKPFSKEQSDVEF